MKWTAQIQYWFEYILNASQEMLFPQQDVIVVHNLMRLSKQFRVMDGGAFCISVKKGEESVYMQKFRRITSKIRVQIRLMPI